MTSAATPIEASEIVDQVSDAVWVIRVPYPGSPIKYVMTYVFACDGGHIVVDPGCYGPQPLAALQAGLQFLGGSIEAVVGVVVTHVHPDHYGLAGAVRALSGAWVGLHSADAALIRTTRADIESLVVDNLRWLDESGAPPTARESALLSEQILIETVLVAAPDRLLDDGDRIAVDGATLNVVHTPGHTPGHICLYDERRQLLLTGDHVLPRITPNVGKHPLSGASPLGDYLRSLERLRIYREATVLPGHEWVFADINDRIDHLLEHHEERMRSVEQLVIDGYDTAWAVAERMSWSRPFTSLSQELKRAALSEALAHLVQLDEEGRVAMSGGSPTRWSPPDAGDVSAAHG
jgi:glyoxylase-like metal-dependent hydrolase (beta-lactamase superfamily II)